MSKNNLLKEQLPTSSQEQDQLITSAKQDFFKYFTQGISLNRLPDGMHKARLKSATFVQPTPDKNGKVPEGAKPYVRLELQLEDRIIVDNRFEQNFGIFESQVKEQLNLADQTLPVQALLTILNENDFYVWTSHIEIEGKQYRNINYIQPKQTTSQTQQGLQVEEF